MHLNLRKASADFNTNYLRSTLSADEQLVCRRTTCLPTNHLSADEQRTQLEKGFSLQRESEPYADRMNCLQMHSYVPCLRTIQPNPLVCRRFLSTTQTVGVSACDLTITSTPSITSTMPLHVYQQFTDYFQGDYMKYLRLIDRLARLRPVITKSSPSSNGPAILPEAVASYLADCLDLERDVLARIWQSLRPHFAELQAMNFAQEADDQARTHGRAYSIGTYRSYV